MKKIIFAAVILGSVLAIPSVLAHMNGTDESVLEDMLEHFRIRHEDSDATVDDMREHHKAMHGEELSIEDMAEMHKRMSESGGCPMRN